MKKRRYLIPVLVVLSLVIGILPASAGQPGTGTTTVYVQNADSGGDAQIVARFFDKDGSEVGSVNVANLAPYVGYSINLGAVSPSLPTSWQGSTVVSSDRQVAAVGHTIYSNVPASGDGVTAGNYLALAEPATNGFLSYVWNHSSRNNIFSVQNTSDSQATVWLHYLRMADGTEIPGSGSCSGSPVSDTIPAGGVVYYDLLNQTRNGTYEGGADGVIPCQDQAGTGQPSAGDGGFFSGSVYITSTQEIATASSIHWTKFEGTYVGATGDDTRLYFPQVVRHKSPSTGRWVRWSTLVVQNTQSIPISVTVTYAGMGASVAFSDTIPALSTVNYNTRYRGSFPDSVWANCETSHGLDNDCWLESNLGTPAWVGAATVDVNTPGGAIVGVAHVQYQDYHTFTYEGLQPSTASQTVVCPFMWDRDSTSNNRYSAAIIQNTSGTTATVDAYVFRQGNTNGGLANADLVLDNGGAGYEIAPNERIGANTRWGADIGKGDFNPLGNDWEGSFVIVSRDEPILASMTIFRLDGGSNERWSTDYDCYNVP